MKISCDVDCTPEEARRFMGLPDLSPVHEAYVARMTKAASEGLTPENMTEMMRTWGSMNPAGTQLWQTMFDQVTGAAKKK